MSSWSYFFFLRHTQTQKQYKHHNTINIFQIWLWLFFRYPHSIYSFPKTDWIFICRQNGWKCYNQRQPLPFFSHLHVPEPLVVLQAVLKRMRFPVYLQDITTMTAFRRDGHPSIFRKAITQEERQKPGSGLSSDCSHWCLPGVPDLWNEMLSALLWL